MNKIISAQRYIDDEIVAAKVANQDFVVALSPVFEVEGESYQVVVDGHHSLAAAKLAGVEPEYMVQDVRDNDTIQMLVDGRVEDFLVTHRIDSDYYDVATGVDVW